ncbi:damage-inducible protein DinB [Deinococcus irradiatisoli]|uniref:Damage-inducible protein DinB n=1 Tax=Deinococcus irradiatisoli TaxID=2202254 RepID=A0A2Z3JHP7_9DEIO|nr:damage-inducible protein DinB [Deinococcus irradiatisoli]
MPELIAESFARNGRVNVAVIAALSEADLDLEDGAGGWTLGKHLGHLADFRKSWLSNISPPHAEGLPEVLRGNWSNFELTTRDLGELAATFRAGDAAALQAVSDALREGRAFADPWNEGAYASSPVHFLQHILVHDAHHRGQIMALLRRGGRTPEQMNALDDATWAIWRE